MDNAGRDEQASAVLEQRRSRDEWDRAFKEAGAEQRNAATIEAATQRALTSERQYGLGLDRNSLARDRFAYSREAGDRKMSLAELKVAQAEEQRKITNDIAYGNLDNSTANQFLNERKLDFDETSERRKMADTNMSMWQAKQILDESEGLVPSSSDYELKKTRLMRSYLEGTGHPAVIARIKYLDELRDRDRALAAKMVEEETKVGNTIFRAPGTTGATGAPKFSQQIGDSLTISGQLTPEMGQRIQARTKEIGDIDQRLSVLLPELKKFPNKSADPSGVNPNNLAETKMQEAIRLQARKNNLSAEMSSQPSGVGAATAAPVKERIKVNPTTGERIVLRDGKWVPL